MINAKQHLTGICLLLLPAAVASQELWQGSIVLGYVSSVNQFYTDETNDLLYLVGSISPEATQTGGSSVHVYDGTSWDTLGFFTGGALQTIVNWHDTLIVGGSFGWLDQAVVNNIVARVNGSWIPYGEFNSTIFKLREIDGELYAVGSFNQVDGQQASGVAKRVGDHWEPVGLFGDDDPLLRDIIGYQGNIVVAGSVWPTEMDGGGILQYDGSSWSLVGGGLSTGMGGSLAVYKDELYFCGMFPIGPHVGESIMRWNGTEWRDLGVGPQVVNGSYEFNYTVQHMAVHDDLLFIAGGFRYVSGVPADNIAVYDSLNWCGFGGIFDVGVAQDLGFYHDTLYYSQTERYLWGDTVNKVLRFIGDTYRDTCSALQVGVQEMPSNGDLVVRYDAHQGTITVTAPHTARLHAELRDIHGRLLARHTDTQPVFDARALSEGVYLVHVAGRGAQRVVVYR